MEWGKKELYLNKTPLLDTYGFLADLLAVIDVVDREGIWLAANYNNIIGYKPDAPFCLYELSIVQNRECGLNMFYQCPFLDFYKYRRAEVAEDTVVSFIRRYIEEGYYVLLNIDREYLGFYGLDYPSNHEVMVYGYDDGKREFLLCDNAINGKYRTDICCTYEEMRMGYGCYVPDNVKLDLHDSILLIAPTEDRFGYEFPVRVFEAQIREYLNIALAFGGRERGEEWIYGFENYRYLIAYVEEIIRAKGRGFRKDIRCFCALLDHKKSLCHTFAYFAKKGEVEEGFLERYVRIAEKALIIRNMVLKLYIKYKEETAVSLLRHMEEMMEEEQVILQHFLDRQHK